jgi:hypothetical protein
MMSSAGMADWDGLQAGWQQRCPSSGRVGTLGPPCLGR